MCLCIIRLFGGRRAKTCQVKERTLRSKTFQFISSLELTGSTFSTWVCFGSHHSVVERCCYHTGWPQRHTQRLAVGLLGSMRTAVAASTYCRLINRCAAENSAPNLITRLASTKKRTLRSTSYYITCTVYQSRGKTATGTSI